MDEHYRKAKRKFKRWARHTWRNRREFMLEPFGLMTRRQLHLLAANNICHQATALPAEFAQTAQRLKNLYPELDDLSFIATDIGSLVSSPKDDFNKISPYAAYVLGNAKRDFSLQKSFFRKADLITLSFAQSANIFGDIEHQSYGRFDMDAVARFIVNHEAGHAMDPNDYSGRSKLTEMVRENYADVFAMFQTAKDMPGLDIQTYCDAWSSMRSVNAFFGDGIAHHTCFALDALRFTRKADLTHMSSRDIIDAAADHVERFMPDDKALAKFDKNTRKIMDACEDVRGGCARVDALGFLGAKIVEMSEAIGTDAYDPCFAYTAAKAMKTLYNEGFFIGRQVTDIRDPIITDRNRKEWKAANNKMIGPLRKDPFFQRYDINGLYIRGKTKLAYKPPE